MEEEGGRVAYLGAEEGVYRRAGAGRVHHLRQEVRGGVCQEEEEGQDVYPGKEAEEAHHLHQEAGVDTYPGVGVGRVHHLHQGVDEGACLVEDEDDHQGAVGGHRHREAGAGVYQGVEVGKAHHLRQGVHEDVCPVEDEGAYRGVKAGKVRHLRQGVDVDLDLEFFLYQEEDLELCSQNHHNNLLHWLNKHF